MPTLRDDLLGSENLAHPTRFRIETESMSDVLWQFENVGFSTRGHFRLTDITLDITTGVTAVLGESGAGKTSLLNLLVGIDQPTTGELIPVGNGDADVKGDGEGRPFVYWVPQDHGLWPHLSVDEHLLMVTPQATPELRDNANSSSTLLDTFALRDRFNAKPAQLSQGERARLSVARALATQARVQVMDEPLAHVDAARRATFWSAIEQHVRQTGASWVFATHEPQTVLAHADRVIALQNGELLFHGEVATLYHDPPSEKAARCLGEVNWMTADDVSNWLENAQTRGDATTGVNQGPCLRPEQLEIAVDAAGPLAVESFVFRGPISHVTLKHPTLDSSRHFAVRTPAERLQVGDRVKLRDLRSSVNDRGDE